MSFKITWPTFSSDFIEKAKASLTVALNSGKKPDNIAGDITVTQLYMGSRPPDLEILEISELLTERFKGMFKLTYYGDAYANPLSTPARPRALSISQGMLLAHKPFVVPMEMKISRVQLKGVITLVVDKEKGITLVFRSDPLESVHVSSTFDNIPSIKKLLQRQIEEQLRSMFQQELPQMIHTLSKVMLKEQQSGSHHTPDVVSPPSSVMVGCGAIHVQSPEKSREELNSIPHHKKWMNNDPVYIHDQEDLASQGGYVLYKTLSVGDTRDQHELGLHRLVDSPKVKRSTSSLMQRQDLSPPRGNFDWEPLPLPHSSSGYFQVGLQGMNARYPGMFISQSELSALEMDQPRQGAKFYLDQGEYEDFERADDMSVVSTWTSPSERMGRPIHSTSRTERSHSYSAGQGSSRSLFSPPASVHKGVPGEVLWHRPNSGTASFRPPRQYMDASSARNSVHHGPAQPQSSLDGASELMDDPLHQIENYRSQEAKVLSPSDNEVTAHLANLMTSHLTISPNTQGLSNLTFRGAPSTSLESLETRSVADSSVSYRSGTSSVRGKRRLTRRVHTVKVPEVMIRKGSPAPSSRPSSTTPSSI
ncbi:ERMES complex subunit [Kappamyces sp. JEL0680]|nr:ERMES complex subunit [Kappamyces sp. JEL0680]